MARIALVTAASARGLDEDLFPLELALRDRDVAYAVVDWDDPEVDWGAFDVALIRSTWDYSSRIREFLAWAERVSSATKLQNPSSLIAWNVDKHYLRNLADAGCATVPTAYVEPGERARTGLSSFLLRHEAEEFVVKPAISGGSRDTQRYRRSELNRAEAHVARLTASGRSVVLQPYLSSVDREGETALIFFRGQFSHAIRKGPLLKLDGEATRALFAPEHISAREPSADELACASQVLASIAAEPPLYARVDLIRDALGQPRLLEAELTEPSLFFDYAPRSADRLVDSLLESLAPAEL